MEMDKGWSWVVLAASMGSMYLNGILTSFMGVIQTGLLRKYGESVTLTAWVGGLFVALVNLAAPLCSFVISRYGCRTCCVVGGVLCLIGMSASAFVTSIGQLFITYGLTAGIGVALTYSPSIVSIGFYFKKYLGLAAGISASSAAIGILSGSLIMQTLIDEYSVDGAFLLIGAMAFHHCLFGMFYRPTVFEKNQSEATNQTEIVIGSVLSLNSVHILTSSVSSLAGRGRQHGQDTQEAQVGIQDQTTEEADVGLLSEDVTCEKSGLAKTEDSAGSCSDKHSDKPDLTELSDVKSCQHIRSTPEQERERLDHAISSRKDGRMDEEAGLTNTSHTEQCKDNMERYNNGAIGSSANTSLPQSLADSPHDQHIHIPSLSGNTFPSAKKSETDSLLSTSEEKCDTLAKNESETRPTKISETLKENDNRVNKPVSHPRSCAYSNKTKSVNRKSGGHLVEVLQNKAFLCHCLSCMLINFAIGGVFVHLPEYVQTLGTTTTAAASLFVFIGIASLVSRLSTAFMMTEERLDPLVLHMGLTGLSGLVNLIFPLFADTYQGQIAYCVLWGLYTGGLNAMYNVMTVRLVGVSLLNTGFGLLGIFIGIGFVTGPTFAALVVDMGGTYKQSFLLLGGILQVAFLLDLTAGLFLKSDKQTEGEKVAVTDGDLMGSTYLTTETR